MLLHLQLPLSFHTDSLPDVAITQPIHILDLPFAHPSQEWLAAGCPWQVDIRLALDRAWAFCDRGGVRLVGLAAAAVRIFLYGEGRGVGFLRND